VVLTDTQDNSATLTKRIVGLPGEKINIKQGKVYINNERLHENYIKEPPSYILSEKIPTGHYFLLGDNRNQSHDSSIWGAVNEERIIGRVFCRYWPWRNFAFF
jgi:signal peptidase I